MILKDKVVSINTIGGSSADNSQRCVGWEFFQKDGGGWKAYIDTVTRKEISWGCRRFFLGCPGGFIGGRIFEMDQFIHARDGVKGIHPKMPYLVNDFISSWNALIKEQAKKKDPIEVICYIGFEMGDPDFDPTKTTLDHRLHRRWESLKWPLQAGMSLGLDYVTDFPEYSEQHRFAQMLAASGLKVYVEGWPQRKFPCWANFNVVCTQGNYNQRTWGNNDFADGWGVKEEDVKGEILILYDENTPEGNMDFAKRHLSQGRSVAIWSGAFMDRGIKFSDIYNV